MAPAFIMVAPTGARRTPADHPALPVTLPDIVETARACHAAGAAALHLHIRDDQGVHSLDPGRYRETLAELARTVPTMRVQVTTESAGIFSVGDQLATLTALHPEWVSLSIREVAREPELADRVYGTCAAAGTEIQHILYDTDDIRLLTEWTSKGIVRPDQTSVILVLGRYSAGQVSNPADLPPFHAQLSTGHRWMLCAFGAREHECLRAAHALGGDLRVGFENSLTDATGTPHASNAASVAALIASLGQQTERNTV
ncbi:3-keto-5-aminohexanoate cleavage protein [Defluviimonas sp. WL0050]|uniref:3-keto-5-aminohexanoate cleavage protein n=1 Tax=Albidovulum litorale TaxID=2984134 RepID=A0ABT2ZT66_9RHOB|nr:3-keto-5-aminohexanoate cleavage protein [Defluviimonas sp. WL0050]MCV2874317.1 3-keto-5-aminohexanoate cleavage protein [Defluviimonas sp. WL0050]